MEGPLIQLDDLEKQCHQGDIPRLVLFEGDETFLVHDATHRVLKIIVPDLHDGFSYVKWDGETNQLAGFLTELMSYPMMGDRKVFHITTGEEFFKKKGSQSLRMKFEKVITGELPEKNMVIVSASGAAEKTSKLFKYFKKHGVVVSFPEIKSYNPGDMKRDAVYPIVAARLQRDGFSITADAFFELRKRVPANLWALNAEIEKLIVHAGISRKITLDDVRSVTPRSATDQIFDLTDAVSSGNLRVTLQVFRDLTLHESTLLGVHTVLVNHLMALFQSRQWVKRAFGGHLPADFSYTLLTRTWLPRWREELQEDDNSGWKSLFSRHPYILFKSLQSGMLFDEDRLLDAIISLQQLENDVKSRRLNHHIALEIIIRRLCETQ